MKEASQTAIESARIILVQSLLAENAIDVESLGASDVEDLKLAIDATLASLKRVILAPVQETMEQRNLRLPINQLPPEILESIFQGYLWSARLDAMEVDRVYKYNIGVYSQAVLSLALVSKRWHRIVLGTPSFWTLVSLAMPYTQTDKWLSLSRSHPLDIYCETGSEDLQTVMAPNGLAVKASLLKFVDAVTPHLGRTRLIRVAVTRDLIRGILQMISTPNGVIEILELHLRYPEVESDSNPTNFSFLALFQGQAPKLARVEIRSVQIDWRSLTCFPVLQTLKLSRVTISTWQIESGLKECPPLRILELDNVFLDVNVPAPGLFLDLPNLQRLVCMIRRYQIPDEWETPFISRIRNLRSLESMHLSVDIEHSIEIETYIQTNIAHLSSDLSRILGSAAGIHIDWDGFRTSINDTAGSFRFELTNHSPGLYYRFLRDIALESGFSGDIDLSVRGDAMYVIRSDTWEWPHLNISRLTLAEERYHMVALGLVSRGLGDFLKDPHHWSTLRCIRLDFKELSLDWLVACLKKRYSGTHGSSVEPQHLNIHIKCWRNPTNGLKELKATHGVDSVILEERSRGTLSTPLGR